MEEFLKSLSRIIDMLVEGCKSNEYLSQEYKELEKDYNEMNDDIIDEMNKRKKAEKERKKAEEDFKKYHEFLHNELKKATGKDATYFAEKFLKGENNA